MKTRHSFLGLVLLGALSLAPSRADAGISIGNFRHQLIQQMREFTSIVRDRTDTARQTPERDVRKRQAPERKSRPDTRRR